MKIRIKRLFRYQATPQKVKEIKPGDYDVPGEISEEMARKILRFGKAEWITDQVVKVAPENKVVETAENKSEVGQVRRRRFRAKSDD